jgi:hypothetical protein
MHPEGKPARYDEIDALLNSRDFAGARAALEQAADEEGLAVLRIKLGLYDESLAPGMAMQRLIQMMRKNPDQPGAKELYQEASKAAYSHGQSSVSHSHPPPAVGPPGNDSK